MKLLRNLLAILAVIQISIPAGAQIGTGLSIPQVAARYVFAGGGDVISPPLTTLPQPSFVGMDINPDTVAQADATEVTSITDATNSITCTAPGGSGPTLKTAAVVGSLTNGHNLLRTTTSTKYLACGRPAGLATAMSNAHDWSVMVVFRNASAASTSYATLFGDVVNGHATTGGITMIAGVNDVQEDTHVVGIGRSYSPGDPASNVHTYIYSGDAGFDSANTKGRLFLDGTMWYGTHPLKQSTNAADQLTIFSASTNAGTFAPVWGYTGDILRVIVWATPLSAAEAWQADAYARVTYGKQLGTVGLTFFTVWDGDSQTMGTGACVGAQCSGSGNGAGNSFSDNSLPWLTANSLGLKLGQYANVGKPSARMPATAANSVISSAARDADQWHTVTGLPIVLVIGEWYNQANQGTGVQLANNNRQYCTDRKAADPTVHIVMWTTLSSWQYDTSLRGDFNTSLMTNPGNCDVIAPVHTDPFIGVDGAAGTVNNVYSTYFSDAIHLNGTGAGKHRDFLLPYVHR